MKQFFIPFIVIASILIQSSLHVEAKTYPFSGLGLSPEESQRVIDIHSYGDEIGLGFAAVGILKQESYAGRYGPVGDAHLPIGERSYGPMQVRIRAAKTAINHCPELNRGYRYEEEIIADLIHDPDWAIRVGYCYLEYNYDRTGSVIKAISSYNAHNNYLHRLDEHEYIKLVLNRAEDVLNENVLSVDGDLIFDRTTYDVRRGDTLWTIVQKHYDVESYSESVELMESIVADNPDAFEGGDINRLESGVTLQLSLNWDKES